MRLQPPLPPSLPVLSLLSFVSGCQVFGGLPRGTQTPVDCTDLPTAPDEIVTAIERSEVALTDGDLDAVEGRVVFELADDAGAQWYLSPKRDDAEVLFRDDHPETNGLRWALRVKLDCLPEAAAFVLFAREDGAGDPLTPGIYPIVAFGFDVPQAEQGTESPLSQVDGVAVVTEATDELVSGYVDGEDPGAAMISYLTGDVIGPVATIGAAAFRDVPVYNQREKQ